MPILKVNSFRKLAKQNGIKRISDDACKLLAKYCEEYAVELVKKASILAQHAQRTTVTESDIEAVRKLTQTKS